MSLPNYSPSGRISFGSVPWDDSYVNVRLYTSLQSQQSDIASMMTTSAGSSDYVYIGRNRRIKVSIPADRLYHCNYCMYRNDSITDGWIYCFVRDVQYVNDTTSELTIETDVFQTFLYSVDWSIPACFIERETTPSEDSRYMLTPEQDFPLVYTVDDFSECPFMTDAWSGFMVMSASQPETNSSLVDDIMNPSGYYATPAPVKSAWGVPMGCGLYYCPRDTSGGNSESLEKFLNELNYAGSVDSVVAIYTIPNFAAEQLTPGWVSPPPYQNNIAQVATSFLAPERGNSVDGYTPRNAKVLYYPYNFLKVADYNGSTTELRYELLGSRSIDVFYTPMPTCKAFVAPRTYMGKDGFDVGFVTDCGAVGSWVSNQFQTWLAQNAGTIALTIAGIVVAGAAGAQALGVQAGQRAVASQVGTAAGRAAATQGAAVAAQAARGSLLAGGAAAGLGYQQIQSASHQPALTRGQADMDLMFSSSLQGVVAERICVKAEIAEQIDEYFDRWGYSVNRIETVNITSRPSWNYVKTQGAAPKSTNVAAGSGAPFSRGRGTPAEALDVIRSCFDRGVTFWHTTDGFGNFALSNGV